MHCGREVDENIIISHNFTLNNFCVCVECVYSLIWVFFLDALVCFSLSTCAIDPIRTGATITL